MYKLENVQRKTTRMVQSLRHVECTGKLKALKLPTLQYQQYTGDMMALYNILRGRYTISTFLTFTISTKPEVMLSNFLRIIQELMVNVIQDVMWTIAILSAWVCKN